MKLNNRFRHIINSEKPVLVYFYADWCQPCKAVPPILKEVKNTFRENIRIVKVNVDLNPFIASQSQVKNIPTLILYQSGQIMRFMEGVVEMPELSAILDEYL